MNEDRKRASNRPSSNREPLPSRRFSRLRQLRKLSDCEQVAAVCYRANEGAIEFLLVETSGGRWTFPKGSTEPGLTHAEAAALEAFEEAGVHGRMEVASFAQYAQPAARSDGSRSASGVMTTAHLCEVYWLEQPQESGRNPSWFAAAKAKRRLSQGRSETYAAELIRVVDAATARVQDQRREANLLADAIRKVRFIDDPRPATSTSKRTALPAKNRRTRPQLDIIPPPRMKRS
jgi:8-oxo-dGTP pyrophosphatase MutT (NUDIX family)